jgi:hypothetical protein
MSQPQLPPGLKNPFLNYKMDVTAGLPPGDVPELHADVLAKCGTMLDHAKNGGEGIGFLVVGEAGSGKSHLVWRNSATSTRSSRGWSWRACG